MLVVNRDFDREVIQHLTTNHTSPQVRRQKSGRQIIELIPRYPELLMYDASI